MDILQGFWAGWNGGAVLKKPSKAIKREKKK